MALLRPTWMDVHLEHLAHNYHLLQRLNPNAAVWAVVKADAYGHGAVAVAKTLLDLGAAGLAVATLEEALQLQQAGINTRILIMGNMHPMWAEAAVQAGFEITVASEQALQWLLQQGLSAKIHLKFDTGMNRVGFTQLPSTGLGMLQLQSVYTHLVDSDSNPTLTQQQLEHFDQLRAAFPDVPHHAANSGACLRSVGTLNWIRPGIALYGLVEDFGLKPVASVWALPTQIKWVPAGQTVGYGATYTLQQGQWIATLNIGYADGLPRGLSNLGQVGLNGRLFPIVGRVSMDQITVALDHQPDPNQPFEVVGTHFGPNSLCGWAQLTHTISYEPATRLATRLPRRYTGTHGTSSL